MGITPTNHLIFLNFRPMPSSFNHAIFPITSAGLPFSGILSFTDCPTSNFSSVATKTPVVLIFLARPSDFPLGVLESFACRYKF